MGKDLIQNCKLLLEAYKSGKLGQTKMPEDASPEFKDNEQELRLAYFSLPMALNYQRDSYKLWESAHQTFKDPETKDVFNVLAVSKMSKEVLQGKLMKYKLALQPNKHIDTWQSIAKTVYSYFETFECLMNNVDNDYLQLKKLIQIDFKKGFPYLSGPKIFNYWSFIISTYGKVPLKNTEFIDIAPDTHVTKCSVILGVISEKESLELSKEMISKRWREVLHGSGINPIDMHPPLWFWSRNGFVYNLPKL